MNREPAIFACYALAEAVNQPAMRKHLLVLYGHYGMRQILAAMAALAEEHTFEAPVLERAAVEDLNRAIP